MKLDIARRNFVVNKIAKDMHNQNRVRPKTTYSALLLIYNKSGLTGLKL